MSTVAASADTAPAIAGSPRPRRGARRVRSLRLAAIWVGVTALLAASPWLGLGAGTSREVVLIATTAMVVTGLNLSLGFVGELAFGQAAIYAAGAYTAAYVAINVINDLLVATGLAILVALVIGILTGVPGLRVGGWVLAVSSFFLVLLVPPVVNIFGAQLGGYEGLTGIPVPMLLGFPLEGAYFFVAVVVACSAWFAVYRNLVTSPHGDAFRVVKNSPVLAQSLGISVYSMKLRAYAIGGIPAGIAGVFTAYLDGFIAPSTFGLDLAIGILAASVLGGTTSIYGPIVGAAIIVVAPLRITAFQDFSLVAYGVLLIVGGTVMTLGASGLLRGRLPRGLRGLLGARRPQVGDDVHAVARVDHPLEARSGARLSVSGASKAFGGNQALSAVTLVAESGQVTALIGPNGSGKTTLMNSICGFHRLDAGSVDFGDETLSGRTPAAISRLGVGRTFQTPLVPEGLTATAVTRTALYDVRRPSMWRSVLRTRAYRRSERASADAVRRTLDDVGLTGLAGVPADALPLGTRRMLELSRVLVARKGLVLLDEVASGIDEEEIQGLVSVIQRLRDAGATVVLVEHNFSLVKALADVVVVLAEGRVIASGTPQEVESDPDVIAKYLGGGLHLSGTRSRQAAPAGTPT